VPLRNQVVGARRRRPRGSQLASVAADDTGMDAVVTGTLCPSSVKSPEVAAWANALLVLVSHGMMKYTQYICWWLWSDTHGKVR